MNCQDTTDMQYEYVNTGCEMCRQKDTETDGLAFEIRQPD